MLSAGTHCWASDVVSPSAKRSTCAGSTAPSLTTMDTRHCWMEACFGRLKWCRYSLPIPANSIGKYCGPLSKHAVPRISAAAPARGLEPEFAAQVPELANARVIDCSRLGSLEPELLKQDREAVRSQEPTLDISGGEVWAQTLAMLRDSTEEGAAAARVPAVTKLP